MLADKAKGPASEALVAVPDRSPPRPSALRTLQHGLGNQAILRLSSGARVSPKLTIGRVDDPMEREADRAADLVMRSTATPRVQRKCAACEDEPVRRRVGRADATPVAGAAPPAVEQALTAAGAPLDAATRAFFEPRFGNDFSAIRVHTDTGADRAATAINANAFTAGDHIVFRAGQYDPRSDGGRRLLAHELAHTLQQPANRAAPIRRTIRNPMFPCFETSLMPGGMNFFGTLVHLAIQQYYVSTFDRDAATEYVIPGFGRADIVSTIGGIYEIKPVGLAELAFWEALEYVAGAEAVCDPTVNWHPGLIYFGPSNMWIDDTQIISWLESPGVIAYALRRRSRVRERVPERVPERAPERERVRTRDPVVPDTGPQTAPDPGVLEAIEQWVRRVYEQGLDAEREAELWLNAHPEYVWAVIILDAIAIVALVADDLTGIGTADDVLVPIAAALEAAALRLAF